MPVVIVSNRQRRILEVLLNRQGEVTAGEMAEEVQISTRTVHRELLELEPILSNNELSLVKKSGVGILIDGDAESLMRFKQRLNHSETATYSPDERKVMMMCRLLEENEPIKLYTLARELNAAIPTISSDLDDIEAGLSKRGLSLVRKRGYGVEIAGPEAAKRDMIGLLAQEYLDDSDLLRASSGRSPPWPVTRQLLNMVGKENFIAIEKSLWLMEEEWPKRLSETAYTNLLIKLAVAITRMQRQHWIKPSERSASGGKTRGNNPKLGRLLECFGLEWPEAEKEYLQRLLDGVEENASEASAMLLDKHGLVLAETAVELIRAVERRMDVPFANDRSLLDGLIRHMGPALQRLREGEVIRNPLLPQIKKDYEALFNGVREAIDETSRSLIIPDEEIGYLVMHFGASIERWKLFPRMVRAILVCTSGIGSSKLLAVRINKEIPQIQLVGHYSWYEAARIPQDRYDLIISTVDLRVEQNRYIKISPLLTREETERLRSYIRENILNKPPTLTHDLPETQGPWERLNLMNSYTSEIVQILIGFEVYHLNETSGESDLRNLLTSILAMLLPQGRLQHEEIIIDQLIMRESQGSQMIPETQLALLHTRSEWVEEPVLSLFRLKRPHLLNSDGTTEVRQILLMLAPKELGKQSLEVLSEISAMLLLPEMIRLLEAGDKETIKAFVSRELEAYIKTKLEWREP
jgi:mannitol operon transcriptional antiterminator